MKRRSVVEDDESIDSDEIPDVSDSDGDNSGSEEEQNYFAEDATEKKNRIIKDYISQLKDELPDDEAVNEKLTSEYEERAGTRFSAINVEVNEPIRYRAHRGRPTAIAVANNFVFSASKDGSIVKVFLNPRKHLDISVSSDSPILCLAYNESKSILASGDDKGIINIWDAENGGMISELKGHKQLVTSLAFQPKSELLFSCSYDATVRIWNTETGQCLNTLYGHEMHAMGIDFCGSPVTCGTDRTIRVWKHEEDKQFVFHGGGVRESIDCISLFNNTLCVSGSQDGHICLWNLTKKRPLFSLRNAHGEGRWITSVAALRYRKLFASGSNDGFIRFWIITDGNRIQKSHEVPLVGYVNDMQFSEDGGFLAVQISQEQRLGRWLPAIKEARQGVYIIKINKIE